MTITERISYIKGLAEGLGLDDSKPESRILIELIGALEEIAGELADTQDDLAVLEEHIDAVDEDLDALESFVFEDDEDFDEEDDDDFDEDELYEVECPNCKETICVDEGIVLEGSIECPNCGEKLEFEIIEEDDDCGCEGCDHDHE